MAGNYIAPTIILALSVAFWGLDSLQAFLDSHGNISPRHGAHVAAGVFFSSVLTAYALALLLLFAYVRTLSRINKPPAGDRFLGRLCNATLAATMASLVAGAALRRLSAAAAKSGFGGHEVIN